MNLVNSLIKVIFLKIIIVKVTDQTINKLYITLITNLIANKLQL